MRAISFIPHSPAPGKVNTSMISKLFRFHSVRPLHSKSTSSFDMGYESGPITYIFSSPGQFSYFWCIVSSAIVIGELGTQVMSFFLICEFYLFIIHMIWFNEKWKVISLQKFNCISIAIIRILIRERETKYLQLYHNIANIKKTFNSMVLQ